VTLGAIGLAIANLVQENSYPAPTDGARWIELSAPTGLCACEIFMDEPSVMGTENALMAAAERALADAVHALDDLFPHSNYRVGTRTLAGLTDEAIDAFVRSAEAMPPLCALNVHHAHGAATRGFANETVYPYRDEHLVVEILGHWAEGDGAAESAWVEATGQGLDPHALPGGWPNLMAAGDPRVQEAYGVNADRLLATKAHYDPDGVFSAIPLPDATGPTLGYTASR